MREKERNQEGRRETEREEERRNRERESKGKSQGKERPMKSWRDRNHENRSMPTKKSKQKPQLTLGVIPTPTTIAAALANEMYS